VTRMTLLNLLAVVFPLILGFLVRWIMQALKGASDALNRSAPWVKQVVVVVISAILSVLSGVVGVNLGTTLDGITAASLTTFLTALFAMVTHNGAKLSNELQALPPGTQSDDPSKPGYRDPRLGVHRNSLAWVIVAVTLAGAAVTASSCAQRDNVPNADSAHTVDSLRIDSANAAAKAKAAKVVTP
jgi:hypothetical protein